MPKVFIVNKAAHDHSDAKRFGELIYLSEGAVNRYSTNTMFRDYYPILLKSSPNDYILPTGLTVMSVIAASIFSHLHGRLNLLIYKTSRDGGDGHYLERKMVFKKKGDRKGDS